MPPIGPGVTLREAKPVKQFGNLFIFSGTFYLPGQAASELYWRGFRNIYVLETGR